VTRAIVRHYRDEDFSQVVEIATDLLASDRQSAEAVILSASRDDRFRIFVAEAQVKVVGFIILEITGWFSHIAHISWIAVRYKCRRQGYGTTLIKEAEHYSKQNSIVRVEVETNPDNKIAVPFYVKNGYQARGVLKHWGKDGGDCLILAKDLI
jgi:ribosomal protein S18 acetylase RimI-like enzyme